MTPIDPKNCPWGIWEDEPFAGINVVGTHDVPPGYRRVAMDEVYNHGNELVGFAFGTLDENACATELFRVSTSGAGFFVRKMLEAML